MTAVNLGKVSTNSGFPCMSAMRAFELFAQFGTIAAKGSEQSIYQAATLADANPKGDLLDLHIQI